jgi:hypothetical protein
VIVTTLRGKTHKQTANVLKQCFLRVKTKKNANPTNETEKSKHPHNAPPLAAELRADEQTTGNCHIMPSFRIRINFPTLYTTNAPYKKSHHVMNKHTPLSLLSFSLHRNFTARNRYCLQSLRFGTEVSYDVTCVFLW